MEPERRGSSPATPAVAPDPGAAASPWLCPNCAIGATHAYCARCGQNRDAAVLSVPAWLRRGLSETFDLDGRLIRTLSRLFRRPGDLTRAWIEGRRASLLSPLRLYLLASAALFGVLALPGVSVVGYDAVRGGLDGAIDGWTRGGGTEAAPAWMVEASQDPAAMERIAMALTDNLPRAMFLLLPFAALLLRVFVRRPHRHFVIHLVWALHVHAAAFLLAIALLPLAPLRGPVKLALGYPVSVVAAVWLLWYVVKAFSAVYERSAVRSALILFFLSLLYLPASALVVVWLSRSALG